jgi:DNA (cytosine-5)-methyltransferase 1
VHLVVLRDDHLLMGRPRLLDLFCGAGGAAMGYHRAGFEVVGIDSRPQPRYPFEFHRADAMTWPLEGFDAIHASPPCQDHRRGRNHELHGTAWMLDATRQRIAAPGVPWVIENVPGAPLRVDLKLCGCMFGLWRLQRERWFETSWHAFDLRPPCLHLEPPIACYGGGGVDRRGVDTGLVADRRRALGIGWMTRREMSQAIPPAYTEYVGELMLRQVR